MIIKKDEVTKRILKALNEFYLVERKIREDDYEDAELETIKEAVQERLKSHRKLYQALHQNTKHL